MWELGETWVVSSVVGLMEGPCLLIVKDATPCHCHCDTLKQSFLNFQNAPWRWNHLT